MRPDDYQIEAIVRALNLCEQRLREPLTIAEMAEAACYSVFHFCRVFAAVTGHSPHQYLLRRRLSEAAREVESRERNISAIAFDYCFGAPETFARAFRRVYGALPSEWRDTSPHDPRIYPQALSARLLEHLHNKVLFVDEQPTLSRLYGYSVAAGEDLDTAVLHRRMSEMCDSGVTWGARLFPSDWPQQPWCYFVGVETPLKAVSSELPVPGLSWVGAGCDGGAGLARMTLDCLRLARIDRMLPLTAPALTLECVDHVQRRLTVWAPEPEW